MDLKSARRVGTIVRDDSGNPALAVENPLRVRALGRLSVLRNRLTGQGVCGWSAHADERVVLSGDVAVLVNDDGRTWVLDARDFTTVRQAVLSAEGLVRMWRTHPNGGVETTGDGSAVASADGRVVVAAQHSVSNSGEVYWRDRPMPWRR